MYETPKSLLDSSQLKPSTWKFQLESVTTANITARLNSTWLTVFSHTRLSGTVHSRMNEDWRIELKSDLHIHCQWDGIVAKKTNKNFIKIIASQLLIIKYLCSEFHTSDNIIYVMSFPTKFCNSIKSTAEESVIQWIFLFLSLFFISIRKSPQIDWQFIITSDLQWQ